MPVTVSCHKCGLTKEYDTPGTAIQCSNKRCAADAKSMERFPFLTVTVLNGRNFIFCDECVKKAKVVKETIERAASDAYLKELGIREGEKE